ncbi:MAG: hypothetical protein B7Y25_02695 [Alphaproteobacteria bacterium 16-39-46]|nr:MAG: hypothetical protein B7Y25_02695 [Alphaproteobacteria bacterium 16-39-46]OZA43548.1 MAG: hypothetical protein B7X84_02865 [Alphaproteobacteria bacterium 17-39-52]HQS83805.1 hypothetical protein [Alphaproteobacteria bacterium]HQS93588.1 hypothetical protein [Alphaproteobacteria bacterium]
MTKRTAFIVFLCVLMHVSDVFGGFQVCYHKSKHGECLEISLNKGFSRTLSTFTWGDNLETVLPQDKTRTPYRLRIDLEGFDGTQINNIGWFLSKLSQCSNHHILDNLKILILDNGTSYKFNRLFFGLQEFSKHVESASIIYRHKGTQTPKAALEGFEVIEKGMARRVEKEGKEISLSPLEKPKEASEEDEEIVDDLRTLKEQVLRREQILEEEDLTQKWTDLKLHHSLPDWMNDREPFLGIKKQEDILDIHSDDLPEILLKSETDKHKFLSVRGASSEDIEGIISVCQKENISYLRITNSSCRPEILEQLVTLLTHKKMLIDVEEAFVDTSGTESLDLVKRFLTEAKKIDKLHFFTFSFPNSLASDIDPETRKTWGAADLTNRHIHILTHAGDA